MAKSKTTPVLRRPIKPKRMPEYPGEHPPHHHKRHHTHAELVELVIALEAQIMALSAAVTAALDAQDQKIAALSTKVDEFIATHAGNSAADDAALVDRVNAQGAAVDAIAAKLVP